MRLKFMLAFLGIALLVAGCLLPWMTIESKNITVTGVDMTGTSYGKPGYFHFLWAALFLIFLFIPKVWAQRVAIGIAAFNVAWAIRNFLVIPVCQMGECPQRELGLYLLLPGALVIFLAPMFGKDE